MMKCLEIISIAGDTSDLTGNEGRCIAELTRAYPGFHFRLVPEDGLLEITFFVAERDPKSDDSNPTFIRAEKKLCVSRPLLDQGWQQAAEVIGAAICRLSGGESWDERPQQEVDR